MLLMMDKEKNTSAVDWKVTESQIFFSLREKVAEPFWYREVHVCLSLLMADTLLLSLFHKGMDYRGKELRLNRE